MQHIKRYVPSIWARSTLEQLLTRQPTCTHPQSERGQQKRPEAHCAFRPGLHVVTIDDFTSESRSEQWLEVRRVR